MYARVLGLRHVNPGGLLCFGLFEGTVTLSALLAFAELADWWTVLVLPALVALMVKLHDIVVGMLGGCGEPDQSVRCRTVVPPRVIGRASVPLRAIPERFAALKFVEAGVLPEPTASISSALAQCWVGSPEQRARQVAARRYE